MVRRDATRVQLLTHNGHDWADRFPLIAEAGIALRVTSCLIDGEAVACDDDGVPSFDRIRYRRHDASVFLYAFDLIELDGVDLRRDPLDVRKATLASLLKRAAPGLRLNEHIEADGPGGAIAHNQPFCDGHHIVKLKPAIWVYPSKWANGRVPCLLPLYFWKHLP
jgi:ATP-dependent DNA ligase